MRHNIGWILTFTILSACYSVSKQASEEQARTTDSKEWVTLSAGYPEEKNSLTLDEWADTVFYVRLQCPGMTDDCQVHYLDSLILTNDNLMLKAFSPEGNLLYQLPNTSGCMDVLAEESAFYLYNFEDGTIKKYSLDGKELKKIHLREEMDTYGRNFVALNDTLFAISMMNVGYNPYELFFVNGEGRMVHRLKNREPFRPQNNASVHNSVWHHRLFRSEEGCRYYPSYSDTLYEVRPNTILRPVLTENKITKVPLEHRLEYSGQHVNDYIKESVAKNWNAVRHFETSRFCIMEYKAGGHNLSLSNYLIYDKTNGKLHRTNNRLNLALKEAGRLHFGIFNDYDGGLAFAPSSQSGEYLVMVNASKQQGGQETHPHTLFQTGRTLGGKNYQVRSDVWSEESHRQQLTAFFRDFDEKQHSMLMIVKPKK